MFQLGSGYRTYLACFMLGLLVAWLVTPLVIRIARWVGAMDAPGLRKVHLQSKPLWGGIAVYVGMWVPLVLLSFWDNLITQNLSGQWQNFVCLFLAGLAMLGLGMVDDRWGLKAPYKVLVQIPVAVALVWAGVSFGTLTVPGLGTIELGFWGPILTVLWLVGITNALNLIDGVDGLATGVTFLVAGTTSVVALYHGNLLLALVMLSLSGASLGFLRFNWAPARVFLGDTGSLSIGMTLAAVSIMANSKGTVAASLFVPLMVLGYPVIDTLLAIVRRSMRGKSWFTGDAAHIHHRLLARGLSHRQAALVLYGVCLLFCLAALGTLYENNLLAACSMVLLGGVVFTGLWVLGYLRLFSRYGFTERSVFRTSIRLAGRTMTELKSADSVETVAELLRRICAAYHFRGLSVSLPGRRRFSYELEPGAARAEELRFEDTGLTVSLAYPDVPASDELALEQRTLVKEIVEHANLRVRELRELKEEAQAPAVAVLAP